MVLKFESLLEGKNSTNKKNFMDEDNHSTNKV